jgi:hydroxybutyrate-dimer hydrolase
VTNAQHLDTLNALPGFNARFIPLHRYFIQAMDLMYDHLRNGAALPPSQVVHTVPRGTNAGGTVPPISAANVPPIDASPPADRVILFTGNEVRIPD